MSNSYREVTRTGYLRNILNSFVGALIGLLLFFGSFFVVWWNEGRTNLAVVAEASIAAPAATVDTANAGKFLAVTGDLVASEPVGDAPYLQPGNYLLLNREVEMFAWVEDTRQETRDKIGGGSETITEYRYEQKWTDSPENSSGFHEPTGHTNPPLSIDNMTRYAAGASVGAYAVDLQQMTLPAEQTLPLTAQMIASNPDFRLVDTYLFQGQGSLTTPQIGDVRISYHALPDPTAVTTFGQQEGARLVPYTYEKGHTLFRALTGDRASAIAQLQTEHTITTWLLRGGAFLMIWFGLMMVLSPLGTIAGILPILKQLTGFVTGLVTFVVALVVWSVVTVISVVLHNIWLALIAAALVVAVAFWWLQRRRVHVT